ncbi:SDR family NAD(P)-dependent oxidoreductase [Paraburkholderia mimosarum]|uniref:SDR family NAD(P)-dependent oxidoreductase n=1 Tax=Paraburkholderia mimosarum TaxID=312026 RepID=UPI00041BC638|nr:SDR family oxidoreductase [Paraburkholderia mimosarum]
MRLAGKSAIVTGAAGGIGRAIADAFAREGASVVLTDICEPPKPLLANQMFVKLDVSDPECWQVVVHELIVRTGRVDVLVNNAAVINYQSIHEVVLEDWNRSIAVNQTGPMLGMRAVLPWMRTNGGGSIINVTSSWSVVAAPGVAAYHATKGALRMMTKNAAMTYAAEGVRVNAIVPGIVRTPLTDRQPDVTASVVAKTPLGLAEPEQIAAGAVFLASDEASAMTGSDMFLDGGYTIP